ncbi:MAG: hypothetical protein FWE38_01795 [Firmicutes bacterium]|nr:hypothetical protein [Bacillota bacterium]
MSNAKKPTRKKTDLAPPTKTEKTVEKVTKVAADTADKVLRKADKPINTPAKRAAAAKKTGAVTGGVITRLNKMNAEFEELFEDTTKRVRDFRDRDKK